MILNKMPEGVDFFNAVVCPIFFSDGTLIVLQKRADHPIYPGLWVFPAGRVKPEDSSVEAAVLREIKEETGFTYRASSLIGPVIIPSRHQKLDGQYFYFNAYIYCIKSQNGRKIEIIIDPTEHKQGFTVYRETIMDTPEETLIPDAKETLILIEREFGI